MFKHTHFFSTIQKSSSTKNKQIMQNKYIYAPETHSNTSNPRKSVFVSYVSFKIQHILRSCQVLLLLHVKITHIPNDVFRCLLLLPTPAFPFVRQLLSVTETETLAAYMKPPSRYGGGGGAGGLDDGSGGPAKGFVVRDAPWNAAGNKVGCPGWRSSPRCGFCPRCSALPGSLSTSENLFTILYSNKL